MAQKKTPKARNSYVTVMRKRFKRKQVMRHRADRRPKDARNHWSNDGGDR